jgi:hypothetical protein
MRTTGRPFLRRFLLPLAILAAWASPGRAGPITAGAGLEGLGSFSGWFEYTASGPDRATLTVQLRNTSPPADGGYLTAFAFDDPSGRITGAALTSTNPNFRLLGGAGEDGAINAPPFGRYDIGASVTGSFLGGGSPRGGIGVGDSATFTFLFSGHRLDELTGESLFGGRVPDPCDPPSTSFVARFRGFDGGGSDKVPGECPPVPPDTPPPVPPESPPTVPPVTPPPVVTTPEPGTLTLAAVALVLGCGRRVWGRVGRAGGR